MLITLAFNIAGHVLKRPIREATEQDRLRRSPTARRRDRIALAGLLVLTVVAC